MFGIILPCSRGEVLVVKTQPRARKAIFIAGGCVAVDTFVMLL